MQFKVGDIVRHINGSEYIIFAEPHEDWRLEHCGEAFYSYKDRGGSTIWCRC
jgi:hypothetical protein